MTVEACPGEDGSSFIACSHESCDVYDDVAHIPPLTLPDTVAAFHHARKFGQPPTVKEGEVFDIQMRYEVFRPAAGGSITLTPRYWTRYPAWELEFTPPTQTISLTRAHVGTVGFELRVLEHEAQTSRIHHVSFYTNRSMVDGCVNAPRTVQIIVEGNDE